MFDLATAGRLAVAVLGGLAVGIERQWSGHAVGPRARFAGVRTFTLLGIVAGLSGWLWTAGLEGPAVILLGGLSALVVVAYLAASRADVDGTTEVAAFVVMTAGVLAGAGLERVASGIIALTVLLLVEKKRLHRLVSKLDRTEVRSGARFAVMAAVILPLLPEGPFGPWGGIRPRQLWALVLFFSGLSFAGYVARRAVGRHRGYAIAGALGGLLSSTVVTLTSARLSRGKSTFGGALAAGALGANAMLFPRVLVASAVLAPAMARALWPAFIAPFVVGVVFFAIGLRNREGTDRIAEERNPLQVWTAVQMAVLFQLFLYAVWLAKSHFGDQGLYTSAGVLGFAEMDALTVSMSQLTRAGTPAEITATAVTIGALSNTVLKLGLTIAIGRGRFRVLTAIGLFLIAVALGASFLTSSLLAS